MGSKTMFLKDNEAVLGQVNGFFDEALKVLEQQEPANASEYSEWVKTKTVMKYNKKIDRRMYILNNCIYWAFLGSNIGSEQNLHRPVLIVQTCRNSPVCTIIPLTLERLNDGYWYHVDLENGKSTALVEHLRVVGKERIDKPMRVAGDIVTITQSDWTKINDQLHRMYELRPLKKQPPL